MVVVGRMYRGHAAKHDVELLVETYVGTKPEGVCFPFADAPGVFHALLASEAAASRLLAVELPKVRNKPMEVQRWTPTMSKLWVAMDFVHLWAQLPGLPSQYFEMLKEIGNLLGTFVSSKYSVKEMHSGARPTICVRILSTAPLVHTVCLPVSAAGPMLWRAQRVQYLDLSLQCTFCGTIGHAMRNCPGNGKGGSWGGRARDRTPGEAVGVGTASASQGRPAAGGPQGQAAVGGSWAAVVRGSGLIGSLQERGGTSGPPGAPVGAGPAVQFVTARVAAEQVETKAQRDSRIALGLFKAMWPDIRPPTKVHFRLDLVLTTKVEGKMKLWTPV